LPWFSVCGEAVLGEGGLAKADWVAAGLYFSLKANGAAP